MGEYTISFEEAYQKCEEVLNNNKAYNAFEKWIKNQIKININL